LEKYESELASEKEIDYSDMIREAAKCYDKTSPDPPLKYLIIDELQDISRGRARFVSEVLRCNPNCKLFAVGDDWQSINRFAGSDITIMTEFERYFGNHRTFFLTKTQRFGSLLLEASSMFVQANPEQIKKVLVGARQDSCPMIEIVDTIRKTEEETEISGSIKNEIAEPKEADELGCIDDSEISANLVKGLLKRISKEKCNATVLILARYKHTLRRYTEYIPCLGENSIEFLTVHGSKGREADYAIIVDVTSGKYGFPTEIEDDPIFDLVLAKSMRFPNAEERRLFYVALTRAKIKTFVVTDYRCKSSFVEELESAEYSGLVTTARELIKAPQCPLCGGDTLSRIDGIHGVFYACSSYPRCKGKALRCPYCGRFAISKMNNTFQCLECKKTIRLCPKCKEGFLKYIPEGISRKSGKAFSAFYVCSASSQEDPESCRYKENADNFIDEKL
jgi:DNA helicase-4